uniref:EKC/KEOPS complex subunit GON7 n=1 Tax=Anopheles epiroticus TaxID=199890 RepID=A0A182P4I5_9DIPT
MPAIEATIKNRDATEAVSQEVTSSNMSELITSIKAVKESLNNLLTAIVVQEASSDDARKARTEGATEEGGEDDESSDEPEASDKESNKRQKV